MSCPAFPRAALASAKARFTGGCSGYDGSSGRIPILNGRWRRPSTVLSSADIHGTARAVLSYLDGSASRTDLKKSSKSAKEFASGPAHGTIPGVPWRAGDTWPPNGIRSAVGLKPYTPQHSEGMRMDPAMSVPTPSIDPRSATSAPSPPLDPPAVRLVLWGLSVLPNMLFSESAVYLSVSFHSRPSRK
ncbi:hypothetical protein MPH_01923 [Macrophomina phaseolina MS6]|uniref:Uncharacterized protein n=1 Tax=Macrophomina phaseolina (strain MS6) TaxID=1126212 RepID=K2RDZ5_MACPH|nr:hypothetical protein MPH_01923 [Macrophomina phaseolina MS6]